MLEAALFNILLGTIALPVSGCGGPGCLPIKLCLYTCKTVRTLLLERLPSRTRLSYTVSRGKGRRVQRVPVLWNSQSSDLRKRALSGGKVIETENSLRWKRCASAFTPPRFPCPLPPYSVASLLRISFQYPPFGTPTL